MQITNQFGTARAETTSYLAVEGACTLERIDGYCNGANTFMMFFDSVTAPAANAVPKKALQVFGNDGFSYTFLQRDEVTFSKGVWIATSTSEVNYVADAANKVSGDVTFDSFFDASKFTVVGDYTTAVASKSIWLNVGGPNRLRRVWVKNNNAAAVYALVCPRNATSAGTLLASYSPSTAADPTNPTAPIASGAEYVMDFGDNGFVPYENVPSTGTVNQACTIFFALLLTTGAPTPGTIPTTIATVDFNVKAWYVA